MEQNLETVRILKSSDTEHISVLHAASTETDIRFYINEEQYFYASESKDEEFSLGFGSDTITTNSVSKPNFKEKVKFAFSLLPIFFLILIITLSFTILTFLLASFIDNPFLNIFLINIFYLCISLSTVIVLESKSTPPILKSKHSAEHMMANFLENNNRLPQNLAEIKKSSRFSKNCGSRKKVKWIAENFISRTIAGIILIVATYGFYFLSEKFAIYLLILIIIYTLTLILTNFIVTKSKKIQILTKPLESLLTSITQYSNTTKNVDEIDIVLAYSAAKEWLKLVYPEFYNEKDDVFLDNVLKELKK